MNGMSTFGSGFDFLVLSVIALVFMAIGARQFSRIEA
jgi:hypothetical protein